MNILLLGRNGQVGSELEHSLAPLGQLTALARDGARGLCGDLECLEGLRDTVRQLQPQVIVNAAAYTAVDKAESEPQLAQLINGDAPGVLAEEAARLGAWLVHYSTDYVFDGSGTTTWEEGDKPGPLNVYGVTKWRGEQAIRQADVKHLIFRTQWVYAARGENFIRTMLRLAAERDSLEVVDDQTGAPTNAALIAEITAHALRTAIRRPEVVGTYHLAAGGETTWYGYAKFAIAAARDAGCLVRVSDSAIAPVGSENFPTPARRPHNSRLNTQRLQDTFRCFLPDWRIGVQRTILQMTCE